MNAPSAEKSKKLVDMLYEGTEQGAIEWALGFDDTVIETRLGRNFIQLAQETDFDDSSIVAIRVKNEKGDVVDTIYPGQLYKLKPSVGSYEKYSQVLPALFAMANRAARGADKTLDEVLSELGKLVIPF